jgi:hypothetical protein
MKKVIMVGCWCVNIFGEATVAQLFPINSIRAVIYHEKGSDIVLQSDVRPGLDGQMITLEDAIANKLIEQDAIRHKIEVSDVDADRTIESIQKQYALSREGIDKLFKDVGYTRAEGREFLRHKQMRDEMIDYAVRSDKRMVVEKSEVEAYYVLHPQKQEATVTLSMAFVPEDCYTRKALEDACKQHKPLKNITWDEEFTIQKDELADDRKFIIDAQAGEIIIEGVDGGYELTKVCSRADARQTPLDVCYNEIANILRTERFQQVFDEYKVRLRKEAHIRLYE